MPAHRVTRHPDTPCKHGHTGRRSLTNNRCLTCRDIANAARRARPGVLQAENEYQKARRRGEHRELVLKQQRDSQNRGYRCNTEKREEMKRRSRETRAAHADDADWKERSRVSSLRAKRRPAAKLRSKQYNKAWADANRDRRAARQRHRQASKLRQTPPWLTADHLEQMRATYALALQMTRSTGVPHEVDHVVPLRGRTVRGLHVPWNLQVLTASENVRKGNRLVGPI